MSAGAVLAVAVLLGWASAGSFPLLAAAMAMVGVAQALTLYEPAFAGMTRWFPVVGERMRAMLLVTLFGGLSSTAFMPLTAWLATALGWRGAVAVLAGIVACLALPAFLLLPGQEVEAGRPPAAAEPGEGPRARGYGWLTAACCCQAFIAGALVVHLTPLLLEAGPRGPEKAATLAGLFGLFQSAARLGVGPMIGRAPAAVRVGALLALHFLACGLLLFAASDFVAVGFAAAFGAANGLMTIVRPLAVAEWVGTAQFGAMNGRMAAWTLPFRALAPFLLGLLHDAAGAYRPVLLVLLGCGAAGVAAAWLAEKRRTAGK